MVTGNPREHRGVASVSESDSEAAAAHSASTSDNVVFSPSVRSDAATPPTSLTLDHLDIHDHDRDSVSHTSTPTTLVSKKKKRGQQAPGIDKSGRGLREFSKKVYEKVESKGRTTYNEVADELVAEYADASNALGFSDQRFDEKNIRRRVYDALNVLMAMDILSKDKKEIHWRGLSQNSLGDIEKLKTERIALRSRVQKKDAYLQELQDQFKGYQNLIQQNQQLYGHETAPRGGVALPFILVQTRPNATVEVEISEDMQLVHFDFNSTPFELHDDNYVLKQMRSCEKPQSDASSAGG